MTVLKTNAIQTALTGDWETAISLNEELLKNNPQDIDALNRLAFAYSVIGKTKEARHFYQQVLAIDTLNPIALRGIKRLIGANGAVSQPAKNGLHSIQTLGSTLFLEETGKTKIVELINICDVKTLAALRTGEPVQLSMKRSKIFILNEEKQYLGVLPDNIGKRLLKLIDGGNEYQANLKSALNGHITVFIKETKRANKFKNQPSFLSADKTHLVFEKNSGAKAKVHDDDDLKKSQRLGDDEDFA